VNRVAGYLAVTAGCIFFSTELAAQQRAAARLPPSPVIPGNAPAMSWAPASAIAELELAPGQFVRLKWLATGGYQEGFLIRDAGAGGSAVWKLWSSAGVRTYPMGTRIVRGTGNNKSAVVTLQPTGQIEVAVDRSRPVQPGNAPPPTHLTFPTIPVDRATSRGTNEMTAPPGSPVREPAMGQLVQGALVAQPGDGEAVTFMGGRRLIRIGGTLYVQRSVASGAWQTINEFPIGMAGTWVIRMPNAVVYVGHYAGAIQP
jgi:hypothetical protein